MDQGCQGTLKSRHLREDIDNAHDEPDAGATLGASGGDRGDGEPARAGGLFRDRHPLGPETRAHRCFPGWCDPIGYILRTAAPVDEAVCAEELELRIRLEDRAE